MKLLVLTRYGRLGASSRLRFFQYLPWLEAEGIEVTQASMFSDSYVQGLQKKTLNIIEVLNCYVARISILLTSNKFDLLWIEKETLPWLPAWFEKILLSKLVPYVLDYDDAVFHYYDEHRNPFVYALLSNKHPELIKGAELVVTGNSYLASFANKAGARHVEIVPTVINLLNYQSYEIDLKQKQGVPCVGWIGQRSTSTFLEPYKQLFETLQTEGKARFKAVGIDAQAMGLPMESVEWSETDEVTSIASFDIGIMPLLDRSFERGKCGYKLIQYMACSLPVIASPVGVNKEIVEHGVNGFLAETHEQWERYLRILLDNETLRRQMGRLGRQKVEERYNTQLAAPKLVKMLIEAAIGSCWDNK